MGRPHWWSYKSMRGVGSGQFPLPTMTIVDVVLLSREELLVYDARRMVSSEE